MIRLPHLARRRGLDAARLRELLPLPPEEMRALVGPTEPEAFDQEAGDPVFPTVQARQYASVLDFGCGCGRLARRLALAGTPRPARYLGLDLHRGMIQWDNENIAPVLPDFRFEHHDVFNLGFNPGADKPPVAALPVEDGSVTLFIAWSVFTHLVQSQAEFYLTELARVLAPDGVAIVTWFLFDKAYFPMMQDFQNALYINDSDPSNAVVYDREWLLQSLHARGLRIRAAEAPEIRGFQWPTEIEHGERSIALPRDDAPLGRKPPPAGIAQPDRVGLDADVPPPVSE